MTQSVQTPQSLNIAESNILQEARAWQNQTKLPLSSVMLPASAATQFDPVKEGRLWIAPHAALQIYASFGMEAARAFLKDNTSHTATELLDRIERSRNAR